MSLAYEKRSLLVILHFELSIYDESLVGVDGKVFMVFLGLVEGLWILKGTLDGGMMNNSSYEGVV